MADGPGILAQLVGLATQRQGAGSLSTRLCWAATQILDADGASVTLVHAEGDRLMVCATDPAAEEIENLQEVVGEGPGPEAYESGKVVSVSLEGDQSERWPMFAGAVRSALGPVTIHAIPMRARGRDLGVLTLHQQQSRPLARPMREVRFLANAIGVAIAGDRAESSDTLWSARDRVNQGAGMVVAQLAVSPEDAMALLRAHAFAQDATLDEVATAVVERRLRFTGD